MNKGKITFIGLGLNDEKDISLKGLNEIKNCDKVFAEFYTAKLFGTDIKKIEKQINKKIINLERDEVEKGHEIIVAGFIALICGLLPGHTQNITYIAQRFSLGAAFFCLISLHFYLLARNSRNWAESRRVAFVDCQ